MLNQLIAYFEDRHIELARLSGIDESQSIDWYDGGVAEVKRSLAYLKKLASQQPNAADGGRSWACPSCGGVHDNIDEYYQFCQFCGYPRR